MSADLSEYGDLAPVTHIGSHLDADYTPGELCEDCGTLLPPSNVTGLCGPCAQSRRFADEDARAAAARLHNHRIYVACRWLGLPRRTTQ